MSVVSLSDTESMKNNRDDNITKENHNTPTMKELLGEEDDVKKTECDRHNNCDGTTSLLQLIFDEKVIYSCASFQKFIERCPLEVLRKKYVFSCLGPGGAYNFKAHALFGAIQRKYPYDTIKILCDKSQSKAFEDTDARGQSILHLACKMSSVEVVTLLASRHPPLLLAQDYSGARPLTIACEFARPFELIKWLVEACPKTLSTLSKGGYTPFHVACLHGAPLQVIRYILNIRPSSLMELTKSGDTALHLASSMPQTPLQSRLCDPKFHTQFQLELIRFLVEQYPKALDQKGYKGNTPMERALDVDRYSGAVRLLKALKLKQVFWGICRVKLCLVRARNACMATE